MLSRKIKKIFKRFFSKQKDHIEIIVYNIQYSNNDINSYQPTHMHLVYHGYEQLDVIDQFILDEINHNSSSKVKDFSYTIL